LFLASSTSVAAVDVQAVGSSAIEWFAAEQSAIPDQLEPLAATINLTVESGETNATELATKNVRLTLVSIAEPPSVLQKEFTAAVAAWDASSIPTLSQLYDAATTTVLQYCFTSFSNAYERAQRW
jgi:hypothetical protein